MNEIKCMRWYIYDNERIFVQKLLNKYYYWNSKDGWHLLNDAVKISMKIDDNQK